MHDGPSFDDKLSVTEKYNPFDSQNMLSNCSVWNA